MLIFSYTGSTNNQKAKQTENDFELMESDEEISAKQISKPRQRLKSAKDVGSSSSSSQGITSQVSQCNTTQETQEIAPSDEPKISSKRVHNEEKEEVAQAPLAAIASPTKKTRIMTPTKPAPSPKPAATKAVQQEEDEKLKPVPMKSVLKPLEASSTNLYGDPKKKKEIVGGVDAFFGNPSSITFKEPAAHAEPVSSTSATSMEVEGTSPTPAPKTSSTSKRTKAEAAVTSPIRSPAKKSRASTPDSTTIASASSSTSSGFNEKKFVITGVFHSMNRDDLQDFILQRNGKIASAVSGKTDYLLAGYILEDGRAVTEGSKYRTAIDKRVRILNEDDFMLMAEQIGSVSKPKPPPSAAPVAAPALAPAAAARMSESDQANRLWVDKYRPSSIQEIIGSTDIVKKLSDWLTRYHDVHITKSLKIPFSKENPGAKIVLLSGPPGIGKSTMASIVALHHGYEVYELNASDSRNKKSISEHLRDVVTSTSINLSGSSVKKRLIIMDEVDGMSGNSDRGGIQELLSIAKLSKNPIICICNDRQSPKIRSLANSCYDLRVKRPTKHQIAARIVSIAQSEGLQLDHNAAELLIEQAGNDIRQVLHALQMWQSSASSSSLSYLDMKQGMHRIEKDKVLRQSPFDACLTILAGQPRGQASNLDERYNSFFIDYSLLPLLVQQNYIDSAKSGIFRQPGLDDTMKMVRLAEASDAVSDIDLLAAGVRGDDQHWELLPAQAGLSVRAGSIVNGFQAFPTFPAVSQGISLYLGAQTSITRTLPPLRLWLPSKSGERLNKWGRFIRPNTFLVTSDLMLMM
jgi:replication factor C subunit 1